MDPDLVMAVGIALALISVPPLVGSILHDGPTSKAVAFIALVAVAVMTIAAFQKPGGYSLIELPGIFIEVIRRYV